ncbi:DUF2497 domain-containing protein [Rhodoblastus sp.]|uniref:PopZ family protein n=1 Tax=Rhodoblastus sp. TaxID=1962975 RepID=UPI003F9C2190
MTANATSHSTELSAEQKAHEPSMDDILASIRRIIADDDALPLSRSARATAAPPPAGAVPAAAAVPAQAAPASAAPVADAFFGLGQRLSRQSANGSPRTPSTTVLAAASLKPPMLKLRDFAPIRAPAQEPAKQEPAKEVAARKAVEDVAATEGVTQETPAKPGGADLPSAMELRPSLPEADQPADPPKASVVTLVQPLSNAVESRLKIAARAFRAPAPPAPEPVAEKPATSVVENARIFETARTEPRTEQAAPPPAAPSAPAAEQKTLETESDSSKSEQALVSPASGARIGASFEALAESMLLRDPRMIERLAREMLRPMLKEWLDDNLPNVVERLVRAEIERVARGRD